MEYKVTVYVMTPYSTLVEAESEEEARVIALDRDGPSIPAYLEGIQETEWASDGVDEFPNLGKDEIADVEEV